jgi:RraA family protein
MLGFRILNRKNCASADIVEKFRPLPVANISDSMSRMTAGGANLRPLHAYGKPMCGPAITVKSRPGDNLMIHKALDIAAPGDIIVVDGGGDTTNAMIGELMLTYAQTRKLGGFVIYGAVRDSGWIAAHDFPVYAVGVTHRGPYKDGPGEINVPIAIDGMVIEPGDLIVGDEDGIVSVPFVSLDEIFAKTHAKSLDEQQMMAEILAGTSDRSWIDKSLERLGVEIEPAEQA